MYCEYHLLMTNIFEHKVKTRYYETDQGGRIYHSHYFVWLDITRSEYLAKCGIPYEDFEKLGLYIVVKEVRCDYVNPVFYNQELTILIKDVKVKKITLEFIYEILNDKKLIANAYTKLAVVNREGKLSKLPGNIQKLLTNQSK
jgi:acyl-CoA thioester hydrolase